MRNIPVGVISVCCLLYAFSAVSFGQEPQSASVSIAPTQTTSSTVPRLVSFSGIIKDGTGKPVTGPVSITFLLFAEPEGGTPLWSEMQTVEADAQGNYTVHLGETNPAGLPLDLFTSGTARWLAVQPETSSAAEAPRVLLVGVPYALKAADADTLGGKPASAFVMAEPQAESANANSSAGTLAPAVSPATGLTGSGTTGYLPLWTSSTNLGNSLLYQSGGYLKVGGLFELPSIGTATASKGYTSQPFYEFASAYNSSTKAAVVERFSWQVEPVGNNTASPSGKLNLLFASGTGAPTETGFSIGSNGSINNALILQGNVTKTYNGNSLTAANVIGGSPTNSVQNNSIGATIGGGGVLASLNGTPAPAPNIVSDNFGTVSGGYYNTAGAGNGYGYEATVGGGYYNTASGSDSIVAGGNLNTASAEGSTVSGGSDDVASAGFSAVGGGSGNRASGPYSTVSGGASNAASGYYSTVGGGYRCDATGVYSTVAGGSNNSAAGSYSFAGGNLASASDDGSFVWCQTGSQCFSLGTNSFVVSVDGPIYFYDGPDGQGCYLSSGAGSWTCSSDRNLKTNIVSIDSRSVLERVAQMPISQWTMKADTDGHKHIGPMAQDFYAAFGLGETDKYIAQGDAQGVALASIQGLYQVVQEKLEQKDERIQKLEAQLQALEQRMARFESASERATGRELPSR